MGRIPKKRVIYAKSIFRPPFRSLLFCLRPPFRAKFILQVFLECKIYFAGFFWSAKFILQVFLECKIYFACGPQEKQNKFGTKINGKINFSLKAGLQNLS